MGGIYLSSTNAAVVAVVEANIQGRADLRTRAFEWARERGFEEVMISAFAGRTYVTGLPDQPKGFGRWTVPQQRCSHPFRNNTDEVKLLAALRHDAEPILGLPETMHSVTDVHTGASFLMYPRPFVADGAAWVAYSNQPEPGELDKVGPQWVECLASAYYAAKGE